MFICILTRESENLKRDVSKYKRGGDVPRFITCGSILTEAKENKLGLAQGDDMTYPTSGRQPRSS